MMNRENPFRKQTVFWLLVLKAHKMIYYSFMTSIIKRDFDRLIRTVWVKAFRSNLSFFQDRNLF